jgi:IclR family transcriptional regulator, KDG regulon repressor
MKSTDNSNKRTNRVSVRESRKRDYIVPAVDRAVRILALIRSEGREMTIAEIGEETGWHKSSVHKLMVTLHHHGLLDRDPVTKRYSLGVALSEYGRMAVNNLDVRNAAKPFLRALTEFSGETAALVLFREHQLVMVDVEESPSQIRVSLAVGMSTPVTTTSNGKAVLAFLPETRAREYLRKDGLPALTRKSITKIGAYLAELANTRKRGYATDFEECLAGISAVSAPVFDAKAQVVATLSVSGPSFRMNKEKMRLCGKKCASLASELSASLR